MEKETVLCEAVGLRSHMHELETCVARRGYGKMLQNDKPVLDCLV